MAKPRKQRKKKNNNALLAVVVGILLIAITAALCYAAISENHENLNYTDFFNHVGINQIIRAKTKTETKTEDNTNNSEVVATKTDANTKKVELYDFPDEMKAITLVPGTDYKISGTQAEIKASIDTCIDEIINMEVMNTVMIETMTAKGELIYESGILPNVDVGFDIISYIIDKARENDLYVYTNFYVSSCMTKEEPTVLGKVNNELIDSIAEDSKMFATKYSPNGVMVDGYYNVTDSKAYLNYLRYGSMQGFEEYVASISETLITIARNNFKECNPSIQFGLLSEASWANDYEDERGSATKAYFCALTEGNADTLSYLEKGLADFIAIKAYGSLTDKNIPFANVVGWWGDVAKNNNLHLFVVHAAYKAVSEYSGFSEYDQIARQVIDARSVSNYSGSIFNSLSRMLENPSDFAQKLIGYYEGTVKEEHILQDLELTKPGYRTFTTYNPTVLFAGNTDPNANATINGQKITVDQNGYFQIEMKLSEGENTFNIVHKGKTISYNITRITEVVKEISPASGELTVDGSTKLVVTAVAYEEAKVVASLNGQTIELAISDQEDDVYRDTAYKRFSGTFSMPDAKTAIQDLGAISVTGSWNGISKTKTGATIKVDALQLPSDGEPIVVTADLAETFSASTISSYSEPTYFPLPKGTLDYAVGSPLKYTIVDNGKSKTYVFYKLQSGLRVLADDIAAAASTNAPNGNKISKITVSSDEEYTKVIFNTKQQVSFKATYSSSAIKIQFFYTESLPNGMSLSKNPLFSSVSTSGDTVTLKMLSDGIFFGYDAWYNDDGSLVLAFKNPPPAEGNDLNGTRIVVDPGHGSGDSGATGFLASYPESLINYNIAKYLTEILEDYGADVTMIPTNKKYYSLEDRVAATEKENPDLFISVHNNSSANSSAAVGTEVYYFNPWSSGLATYASKNIANALNTTNRGGKFGYYYVTRTMMYPAILFEGGFVSNQNEYHKLIDSDYQYDIAEGVAKAVISYFKSMNPGTIRTGTESTG